jgi:N-carbamoyl-L-amino-acid hydrolase
VTGVQGIRWYKARVTGTRAHAGSTPMPIRADALVATARIITLLQEQALKWAGVATVGNLHLEDPTSNTIPGSTEFSIDIRHPTEEGLNAIESAVKKEMSIMTLENPKLNFSIDQTWESPAAKFDATALDCIRKSADEEVGQDLIMDMYSLAGHDSALVAKKIPTAMIFVPSRNGLSHSPEEFTSEEDW